MKTLPFSQQYTQKFNQINFFCLFKTDEILDGPVKCFWFMNVLQF